MDIFYVDVDEVGTQTTFASPSQVAGVGCTATGVVTVSPSRTAPVSITFRWIGAPGYGFLGLEHDGQPVASGPIASTPLVADIPAERDANGVFTHFAIVDGDPPQATKWEFYIQLRTALKPTGFWVDPRIENEGAQPIGGGEGKPPGGSGRP